PLVRQYLRVCRQNLGAGLNCSRCERCLRTQLLLLAEGQAPHYRVFESGATLSKRLDLLERIVDPLLFPVYQRLVARPIPADIALAASRLLDRSRLAHRTLRRRAWLDLVGGAARRVWRTPRAAAGRA